MLVIVTDGYPNDTASAIRAAPDARARGIDIIAIGTDDADKALLERLASRRELAVAVSPRAVDRGISTAAALLPGPSSDGGGGGGRC